MGVEPTTIALIARPLTDWAIRPIQLGSLVSDIWRNFNLDYRKLKSFNCTIRIVCYAWKWYSVWLTTTKTLAERGFDPRTSGLWAQHASTAPLCSTNEDSICQYYVEVMPQTVFHNHATRTTNSHKTTNFSHFFAVTRVSTRQYILVGKATATQEPSLCQQECTEKRQSLFVYARWPPKGYPIVSSSF